MSVVEGVSPAVQCAFVCVEVDRRRFFCAFCQSHTHTRTHTLTSRQVHIKSCTHTHTRIHVVFFRQFLSSFPDSAGHILLPGQPLPSESTVAMRGCAGPAVTVRVDGAFQSNIHMNDRTQVFPAEQCVVTIIHVIHFSCL